MIAALHASDCAIYNGPALPVGPCDCGGVATETLVAADTPARTVALLARIVELEALLRRIDAVITWETTPLGQSFQDEVEAALREPKAHGARSSDLSRWKGAFAIPNSDEQT